MLLQSGNLWHKTRTLVNDPALKSDSLLSIIENRFTSQKISRQLLLPRCGLCMVLSFFSIYG